LKAEDIFKARLDASELFMAESVEDYLVALVLATRQPGELDPELERWIAFGASPRGTIALDRCARAKAWIDGHDFVSPDDVRAIAFDVLRHRVLLTFEAEAEGITPDALIQRLIDRVPVSA
jgi:MoxR-like ATPase